MSQNIRACIKTLEKLSLLTCSEEVLPLLERTLTNVQPILAVDTRDTEPLIWQNELDPKKLHKDEPNIKLVAKDLKKNATGYFEDYIAVGHIPKN